MVAIRNLVLRYIGRKVLFLKFLPRTPISVAQLSLGKHYANCKSPYLGYLCHRLAFYLKNSLRDGFENCLCDQDVNLSEYIQIGEGNRSVGILVPF